MFHPISHERLHSCLGEFMKLKAISGSPGGLLHSARLLKEALPRNSRAPSHLPELSIAVPSLYSLFSSRKQINWNYYSIRGRGLARIFFNGARGLVISDQ